MVRILHAENGGVERIRMDTILSTLRTSSNPTLSEVVDEFVRAWNRSGRGHQRPP